MPSGRGQLIQVADHGRAHAEIAGGLVRERFGVRAHRIAGADQRKAVQAGAVELHQPEQVSVPHPPAPDDR